MSNSNKIVFNFLENVNKNINIGSRGPRFKKFEKHWSKLFSTAKNAIELFECIPN